MFEAFVRRSPILLAGFVVATTCDLAAFAKAPDAAKTNSSTGKGTSESPARWVEAPSANMATLTRQAKKLMELLGSSKNKDSFEWYHMMAYCTLILDKPKDSLHFSELALTKKKAIEDPCLNHLALLKAGAEEQLGKQSDALKTYDELLARKEAYSRRTKRTNDLHEWFEGAVYKRKGALHQRMGNFEQALKCYDRAFEIQTSTPSRILEQKPFSSKEKRDAKGMIEKTKESQADASDKLNLAKAYIVLGNYDKARSLLKAASADPYAKYMVDYASARLEARLKRLKPACDEFRKVFRVDPMIDSKNSFREFPAGCAGTTLDHLKKEKTPS